MNTPLSDTVAGDHHPLQDSDPAPRPPEISVWASFGGGDPATHRVREVTVNVPLCDGDELRDYLLIIQTTLRELARLGDTVKQQQGGTTRTPGAGHNIIIKAGLPGGDR